MEGTNQKKWYGNNATLIALITGSISSIVSLINVFLSLD
jgi:hypothetical protein